MTATERGRTSQHTVPRGQHVRLQRLPWEDGDRRVQPEYLPRGPVRRSINKQDRRVLRTATAQCLAGAGRPEHVCCCYRAGNLRYRGRPGRF